MKFGDLVIGFIVFSLTVTLMFLVASNMITESGGTDASDFYDISAGYSNETETFRQDGNTVRDILDSTEEGEGSTETSDVTILTGALKGGRLLKNFFTNLFSITNRTKNYTSEYIDVRIFYGITAIILVIIGLSILHYARGAKAEI